MSCHNRQQPAGRELTLTSISGPAGRRIAIINDKNLMVGDSVRVPVADQELLLSCQEIRSDSVVIKINNQPELKELRLAAAC